MAKRRPIQTVAEMEEEMGFRLRDAPLIGTATGRLFSNLRPVSSDLGERTEKEHQEFINRRGRSERGSAMGNCFVTLKRGQSKIVIFGDDSVRLGHGRGPGSYRFPVDIHYRFGLDLAFLFSESEASHVLSTAKLYKVMAANRNPTPVPAFLGLLPLEIRQTIYHFALPRGVWRVVDDEHFERENFPRGIGDPSGFYCPLGKDLSVLRVNKQIRREALPFAYRRTTFCLDSLDGAVKFLVAAGQIGRENIQTLRLVWKSTSQSPNNLDTSSHQAPDPLLGRPPSHSASTCILLLRQCKRLRRLCVQLDGDLIEEIGPDALRADAGIREVCKLPALQRVEIQELGMVPWEDSNLAK